MTELDSRAAIKGSRDPLGIQPLWTRFGRYVVGNLTTVTSSVRDFTTLLLGYYFVDQLAGELGPGSELAIFLKWEQLAAYARFLVNEEAGFRGVERVQKWANQRSQVRISADQDCQILSNQKTYGLWGLYSMPARTSGLVEPGQPRLTPLAIEFVERTYLPMLEEGAGKDARRIRDVLKQPAKSLPIDHPLFKTIARLMQARILARERDFYRFHLVEGGPHDVTSGRQRQLAGLLEGTFTHAEFRWSPQVLEALEKTAQSEAEVGAGLSRRLLRIRVCESVMLPASMLFAYLLGLDDQPTKSLEKTLGARWGEGLSTIDAQAFADLRDDLGEPESAQRWIAIATAMATGRYSELVDLVLQQNEVVMQARGGAAWVEKRGNRLQVRFRDELGELPKAQEFRDLWRFSYFLDSLRNVAWTLKERSGA